MKNDVERLAGKLAEMSGKIESKQEQVSALLVDGRDSSKVLAELASLQAEQGALSLALEKARSLTLKDEQERQQAERERVRGEIEQLREKARENVDEMLEEALSVKSLISGYYEVCARAESLSKMYGLREAPLALGKEARYVVALKDMLKRLSNMLALEQQFSPSELSGKYEELFRN